MPDKFLIALSAVVSFLVGWNIATDIGEARMTAFKERQYEIVDQLKSTYEKERKNYELRYAESISERDTRINNLSTSVRSLSDELSRMRVLAVNHGTSAVPTKDTSTGQSDADTIAECKRILVEGAELLREGASLLGKNSADHDALIGIIE